MSPVDRYKRKQACTAGLAGHSTACKYLNKQLTMPNHNVNVNRAEHS